jgi:3-methyladenine DNA glycosylase Tag
MRESPERRGAAKTIGQCRTQRWLVQDPSIIRNRARIQATVENARAMMSASPSLAELARGYASTRKRARAHVQTFPPRHPRPTRSPSG